MTPYIVAFTFVVSRALAFVSDARCPSWRLGIALAVSIVVPSLAFQLDLSLVAALACVVPQALLLFITERVETRIKLLRDSSSPTRLISSFAFAMATYCFGLACVG